MFFTYDQNNSGGSFDHDPERGISNYVIIEAATADEANERAEEIGLYFDDDFLVDCDCCGTRWSRPWSDDGDESPKIYGKYAAYEASYDSTGGLFAEGISTAWVPRNQAAAYIHYADGPIVARGFRA